MFKNKHRARLLLIWPKTSYIANFSRIDLVGFVELLTVLGRHHTKDNPKGSYRMINSKPT
jgi:hypothetical protein